MNDFPPGQWAPFWDGLAPMAAAAEPREGRGLRAGSKERPRPGWEVGGGRGEVTGPDVLAKIPLLGTERSRQNRIAFHWRGSERG